MRCVSFLGESPFDVYCIHTETLTDKESKPCGSFLPAGAVKEHK
jgi:hypothetical protein